MLRLESLVRTMEGNYKLFLVFVDVSRDRLVCPHEDMGWLEEFCLLYGVTVDLGLRVFPR